MCLQFWVVSPIQTPAHTVGGNDGATQEGPAAEATSSPKPINLPQQGASCCSEIMVEEAAGLYLIDLEPRGLPRLLPPYDLCPVRFAVRAELATYQLLEAF